MNIEIKNRLKRLACEWVMIYHYLQYKEGADDAQWAAWFDQMVSGDPPDEFDEHGERLWRAHGLYINEDLAEILMEFFGAMEHAVTTFNPELGK